MVSLGRLLGPLRGLEEVRKVQEAREAQEEPLTWQGRCCTSQAERRSRSVEPLSRRKHLAAAADCQAAVGRTAALPQVAGGMGAEAAEAWRDRSRRGSCSSAATAFRECAER